MLADEIRERTVFLGVRVTGLEIAPDLGLEDLGSPALDLARERILGDLRGVDAELLGLRVQVGVDGEAHGLLRHDTCSLHGYHARVKALSVLGLLVGCASSAKPAPTGYDAALAKRIGADEHGMHRFVLALLKPGPHRDQPEAEAAQIMKGHMANIGRLAKERKLVLAGPFVDDGPYSGIFVFDVETVEEAKALTESDPAIQAGRLEFELHPWYGSAALMELDSIHQRVQQKPIE